MGDRKDFSQTELLKYLGQFTVNRARFVGINVNENKRCNLGFHSFKNQVRGQLNTCQRCGKKIYVKKFSETGTTWGYDSGA